MHAQGAQYLTLNVALSYRRACLVRCREVEHTRREEVIVYHSTQRETAFTLRMIMFYSGGDWGGKGHLLIKAKVGTNGHTKNYYF